MNGADSWFDVLYIKYSDSLYRTAKVLLDDPERARELVHDVFVLLLLNWNHLKERENLGGWLYLTLNYRVENEARRAYRTREVPLDLEHQGGPAPDGAGRLEEILPFGLSGGDRQLLIWYYEDNLPHEEIARRLNCSVHACHMRLSRARGRCCRLLTKK